MAVCEESRGCQLQAAVGEEPSRLLAEAAPGLERHRAEPEAEDGPWAFAVDVAAQIAQCDARLREGRVDRREESLERCLFAADLRRPFAVLSEYTCEKLAATAVDNEGRSLRLRNIWRHGAIGTIRLAAGKVDSVAVHAPVIARWFAQCFS